MPPSFDINAAQRFADLALACVHKAYESSFLLRHDSNQCPLGFLDELCERSVAESCGRFQASKTLSMEFWMMNFLKQFEVEVSAWLNISAHPHRFGGRKFLFGSAEVGHIHAGRIVDIPFPRSVGKEAAIIVLKYGMKELCGLVKIDQYRGGLPRSHAQDHPSRGAIYYVLDREYRPN